MVLEYSGDTYLEKIRSGSYEDCEKDVYEVSVIVATYEPNMSKLLTTINSILAQCNVSFQIIVTDDGSNTFDYGILIDYFKKKDYHHYVVTALPQNEGTVKNVNNGLKYAKGYYTKLISPGDYLYGKEILRNWVDFIKMQHAVVSFGDCIHYQYIQGDVKPLSVRANPQKTKKFYKNSWAYNYLVFDDICNGASILISTAILKKYINHILDKVIYAEDNVYRLMAYNDEIACYFSSDVILYEQGLGISTSENSVWSERIRNDWNAADAIMLSWNIKSEVADGFKKVIAYKNDTNRISRVMKGLLIGGKFRNWLEKKIPRYTNTKVDQEYIMHIHK